jgi:hypothetical protein
MKKSPAFLAELIFFGMWWEPLVTVLSIWTMVVSLLVVYLVQEWHGASSETRKKYWPRPLLLMCDQCATFAYSHINGKYEAKAALELWFTVMDLTFSSWTNSDNQFVNKEHFLQRKGGWKSCLYHVKPAKPSWTRHDRPKASYVVKATQN